MTHRDRCIPSQGSASVDASEVEEMLVRVESVDMVDNDSLSVNCFAELRGIETALQSVHRTTAEPLRMVQQVQGQKGWEAWRQIVRRYDQRGRQTRSQHKYESWFGIIRDEEKTLAVRKRLPKSVSLNYRFRGFEAPRGRTAS